MEKFVTVQSMFIAVLYSNSWLTFELLRLLLRARLTDKHYANMLVVCFVSESGTAINWPTALQDRDRSPSCLLTRTPQCWCILSTFESASRTDGCTSRLAPFAVYAH
jgi:hypothetical protein